MIDAAVVAIAVLSGSGLWLCLRRLRQITREREEWERVLQQLQERKAELERAGDGSSS